MKRMRGSLLMMRRFDCVVLCGVAVWLMFLRVGLVAVAGPAEGQRYPYAVFYPDRNPAGVTDALALNNHNVFTGVLGLSAGAFLPSGKVLDLGTLGGEDSLAQGINDRNEIVGNSTEAGGSPFDPRPVVWRNGIIELLPTLGGDDGMAFGINNMGQIVGWTDTEPGGLGPRQATLWDDGRIINLGAIGNAPDSKALGINDLSQVVGWSSATTWGAALWDNGKLIALAPYGIYGTTAFDINNEGIIIGKARLFNESRSIIWINGKAMTAVLLLDQFNSSSLWAINDHSVVVGVGAGDRRLWGFIWKMGESLHRLDNLVAPNSDVQILAAHDINNSNQITGRLSVGDDPDDTRAYFMTPVDPELVLGEPVPGVAGVVNSFTVTGARPGAEVTFVYGIKGGGRFVPHCAVLKAVLQIDDAVVMGKGVADGDGVVRIEMFVPDRARDEDILMMQCFDEGNCEESELRVVSFE